MDSFTMFHFVTRKNSRLYQFSIEPGAPFDDCDSAFLEFMTEFTRLRVVAKEREDKAKQDLAAQEAASAPIEVSPEAKTE